MILYEIPLLAIISEVRNRYRYREVVIEQVREQLYRKLDWLKGCLLYTSDAADE